MTFYVHEQPDGTIHVQNMLAGMLGQHHVHTPEDYERWRNLDSFPVSDEDISRASQDTNPCTCGLAPGESRSGR